VSRIFNLEDWWVSFFPGLIELFFLAYTTAVWHRIGFAAATETAVTALKDYSGMVYQ
jgi:hypothetical protein